jgi:hypothetical protein
MKQWRMELRKNCPRWPKPRERSGSRAGCGTHFVQVFEVQKASSKARPVSHAVPCEFGSIQFLAK